MKKVTYKLKLVNALGGACGTRLPTGSLQPLVGYFDVFKVKVESDQIPDVAI